MHQIEVYAREWCMPVCCRYAVYAVVACLVNRTLERSLSFSLTRIMMKIFKTNSEETVTDCRLYFGLPLVADAIKKRKINFLHKISTACNVLC